jgi:DNA-binding response OmpR family regulator
MDKDAAIGNWIRSQLAQIQVEAKWVGAVADLLAESEAQTPPICLVALRPPIAQAIALIRDLIQEPRFAQTAFILMGSMQDKHAAFEAGADDYLVVPPDVIELRKRVRLYLDRAQLEARIVAEARITQEMEKLFQPSEAGVTTEAEALTLLEHAARLTQERDRFEVILRCANEAISLVGIDGTVLYANPVWETGIGGPSGLAVGDRQTWPPAVTDPAVGQALASAIAERHVWQGDCRIKMPGGIEHNVSMTISPAFDANDELVGFVITQKQR